MKGLGDLVARLTAEGERVGPPCADPVNLPMIRAWTQALGDAHPAYLKSLAPPAMIQVWSMPGLGGPKTGSIGDEPLKLLNDSGFTGVVATNCEQTYDRYLRHGEELRSTTRFGSLTGPKKTALGEGYFLTWYQTWYVGDERVAQMLFRVLKFKPRPARGAPIRPAVGLDTSFFWEGVNAGELRIQRCADCGALRHPPGPICPRCHSVRREHVVASGRGEVHSYVVHHHPPIPGKEPPFVVALIDLPEGVRMLGNLLCAPSDVRIGMPVEVGFQRVDDELTLPQWQPPQALYNDAGFAPMAAPRRPPGVAPMAASWKSELPVLRLPLTPTFVISTALATKDFTPVHHDIELAKAQGSKDIFLNILTTMGLVERFVTDWAPDATLAAVSVKLGVPAYAGDTLTLTGRTLDETTVEVRGSVSLGDHVTATVRLREAP